MYIDAHPSGAVRMVVVHMWLMEGLNASQTVIVALHLNIMESIFVLYVDVKKPVSIGSRREGNVVVLVSHLQQESLWKMDSQKQCQNYT